MTEIKSAIELAMEKTKGLHLSPQEKERLKEEKIHSKAQSLVNRFLEVDFHLKEVEKELSKYNPPQRKHLEDLMIQYLAEAIQLDKDNDLPFQGMEALQEENKSIIQKIRELIGAYGKRKGKEYQKVESALGANLSSWESQVRRFSQK